MLPKKPNRQDAETLAWEYLDGTISPSRAETLSAMLAERAGAREQFVECAVMNSMLHAMFNDKADEKHEDADTPALEAHEPLPQRKKRRRSSAA